MQITIQADNHKDLAIGLIQMAVKVGADEKINFSKYLNGKADDKVKAKDSDAEGDDETFGDDDTENENEDQAPTDSEITKAFKTYAEEKGMDKAKAILKKLGVDKPKEIPEEKRAKVIEKLGV